MTYFILFISHRILVYLLRVTFNSELDAERLNSSGQSRPLG